MSNILVKVFITAVIFGLLAAILANGISFTTVDLGRHLKNGEVILATRHVPQTNLFSYTYPDYPFVNHHWGTGVIFYAIFKAGGFLGLHLFSIAVRLLAFGLVFWLAWRFAGFGRATFLGLIFVMFASNRTELRPELFSYLFVAAYFFLLWNFREGKVSGKWLALIPVMQLLWVNLHLYFFLGFIVVGAFFLEFLFGAIKRAPGASRKLGALSAVLVLMAAASLGNPAGLKGALYPARILENRGAEVSEERSLAAVQKALNFPVAFYFKLGNAVLLASWIYLLARKPGFRGPNFSVAALLLSLFFAAFGWTQARNLAFLGYVGFPIAAFNFRGVGNLAGPKKTSLQALWGFLALLLLLFLAKPKFWKAVLPFDLGLKPGVESAAEFLKRERIAGPIFNDYDIGSYLIYHLYPRERVFVDNRPEAYPPQFYAEEYKPMQENEAKWRAADERFGFNAIAFNVRNQTTWGQNFLRKRLYDDRWAPVYADKFIIVFLKRSPENGLLISRYEIAPDQIPGKVLKAQN